MTMTDHTADQDERTPLLSITSNGGGSRLNLTPDELDFDARFKKWKAAVAAKFRRSRTSRPDHPSLLVTLFDGIDRAAPHILVMTEEHKRLPQKPQSEATSMTRSEFDRQVQQVKAAITHGIYPKMITTGSSGSYFVRIPSDPELLLGLNHATAIPAAAPLTIKTTTVAVFKPKDEEPYGNLNPKRKFLRKYLWWAMGRPCLIPNFSYLSEVGASFLDSRLVLRMVPRTELVNLSSPTFHYAYSDRKAYEEDKKPLPDKVGSYQTFLHGYAMASDFLRRHPWPSRSRSLSLMMRDFDEERMAHRLSRKKEKARLRKCGIALKRFMLCRHSFDDDTLFDDDDHDIDEGGDDVRARSMPGEASHIDPAPTFYWTPKRMHLFRLELEKLVVLDFLMRNTDRGLDNFMIRHDPETDEIKIGAIDNSLSFPIKHPNEIRQYPYGWLFLPSDLIGLPFSRQTRDHFLPILNDPVWWQATVKGLREIFEQDPLFDQGKFERQVSVLKGQAWNLVHCLEHKEEGPLDLCAREKKLVRSETLEVVEDKIDDLDGAKIPLAQDGRLRIELLRFAEPGAEAMGQNAAQQAVNAGQANAQVRPIGIRTSMSYREALKHTAGNGNDHYEDEGQEQQDFDESIGELTGLPEGAHPRSLPEHTVLDPFSDFRRPKHEVAPNQLDRQASVDKTRRPSSHQRIFSLQEPSMTNSRISTDGWNESGPPGTKPRQDILGRTGIEVLEEIDRQRRNEGKVRLFRGRKRSMTASSSGSWTMDAGKGEANDSSIPTHESAQERLRRLSKDVGSPRGRRDGAGSGSRRASAVDNEVDPNMVSSIVSDPGFSNQGSYGSHGRTPSRGKFRRTASAGLEESILSEEEEEVEDEDEAEAVSDKEMRRSPSDSGKQRNGDATSSYGAFGQHKARPYADTGGPSIETVLQQADQCRAGEKKTESKQTVFVPHLPHARAIASASTGASGKDSAAEEEEEQAPQRRRGRASSNASWTLDRAALFGQDTQDDGNAGATKAKAKTKKARKIKVIVERLVSDTRQAWLSWL